MRTVLYNSACLHICIDRRVTYPPSQLRYNFCLLVSGGPSLRPSRIRVWYATPYLLSDNVTSSGQIPFSYSSTRSWGTLDAGSHVSTCLLPSQATYKVYVHRYHHGENFRHYQAIAYYCAHCMPRVGKSYNMSYRHIIEQSAKRLNDDVIEWNVAKFFQSINLHVAL